MRLDEIVRWVLPAAATLASLGEPSLAADPFTRGDVDQSGRIAVVDAIRILEKLFQGGDVISCEDAADVDDDGSLTVTDPIFLLEILFRGRLPPPAPFPGCGEDPTGDGLSCEAYEACRFTFTFFGQKLSADAVFFVTDRSPPIGGSAELSKIRTEIARVITSMPDGLRFALFFFDANTFRFPSTAEPAVASEETRATAASLANQMVGGSGTCPGPSLQTVIAMAKLSGARRNLILYTSDGGGTCMGGDEGAYLEKTLNDVTLANSGLARIHTFGALLWQDMGRAFLQDLAERNGGVFTVVSEQ